MRTLTDYNIRKEATLQHAPLTKSERKIARRQASQQAKEQAATAG